MTDDQFADYAIGIVVGAAAFVGLIFSALLLAYVKGHL